MVLRIQEICYINEPNYQLLCSEFSPAYLSGSAWYVGESLYEWFCKNQYALTIQSNPSVSKKFLSLLSVLDSLGYLIV
jgi:hypothetical protein